MIKTPGSSHTIHTSSASTEELTRRFVSRSNTLRIRLPRRRVCNALWKWSIFTMDDYIMASKGFRRTSPSVRMHIDIMGRITRTGHSRPLSTCLTLCLHALPDPTRSVAGTGHLDATKRRSDD
jgi:hypothetical protein